jgi:hypothetical protein
MKSARSSIRSLVRTLNKSLNAAECVHLMKISKAQLL